MDLNFHWINLLILFGAVQGLIFGISLLFNRKHPGAVFLSIFMFTLAYNGFETFNWSASLDRYFIFFDLFPFIVIFAAGPSLYLYVSSILHPDRRPSRKRVLLYFSPVLFQFVIRAGVVIYHLLWINGVVQSDISGGVLDSWYVTYSEPVSVIFFISFFIASVLEFYRFRKSSSSRVWSREAVRTVSKWIRALLLCMTGLAIAWPLTILTPLLFEVDAGVYYYPIELLLVLFIYWIAMAGYHRTRVIHRKSMQSVSPTAAQEAQQRLSHLKESMEREKWFMDPELNLRRLAALTGIAEKTISGILNQYDQTNFNDFINGYRVREVCNRLGDESYRHLTISGIAFECGFNSQATFQRAFRLYTGVSPRTFLEQQLKKTG